MSYISAEEKIHILKVLIKQNTIFNTQQIDRLERILNAIINRRVL